MDGLDRVSAGVALPPWAVRRRFDVDDYYRLADAGILGAHDRCELVEGEIIEMYPTGGPHIGTIIALHRLLFIAAGDSFVVSVQNSFRLDRWSEPEPDLALLRPRVDRYRGKLPPMVEDAVLVVEVAHTSLRYDSQVKRPLYARHGIPELWIVDVAAGVVEVCREPVDGDYRHVTRAVAGQRIDPLALPGAQLAVTDIVVPAEP